jgi:tRNA A-37 threonylcarbamoyl transferase component Bud32
MVNPTVQDATANDHHVMNWEDFFQNYRKPDFIPGFSILNKLGSGAFGEVYRVRKTSIGKDYAIKFLRFEDARLREHVLSELMGVDQLARVDHPNLVSIEDRGEVCGIPYIVMGFAGEETLKTLLIKGALPQERAKDLFRQVLSGVACLHEHGIIHFDLKPGNIFLRGDTARVGDYGLSKLMSESRATLSMGRGTPYYMAPEMLRRRGDARSDVYSLGIILYEILLGDVPFKGDSEWEILRRHETERVVIDPKIPAPLRTFLEKSLEKVPAQRFANAGDQLREFEMAVASCRRHETLSSAANSEAEVKGSARPMQLKGALGTAGEVTGRVAGRAAARGHATLGRVVDGVAELLAEVREQTRSAVDAARKEFQRHSAIAGGGQEMPSRAALRRGQLVARRKAGDITAAIKLSAPRGVGFIRSIFRGTWVACRAAIRLVDFLFHNILQVLVIMGVLAILCYLVHLGLTRLIP